MQKDCDCQAVQQQLKVSQSQLTQASVHAQTLEDHLAAWRQVQSNLLHSLPQDSTCDVRMRRQNPRVDSNVPSHDVLRFHKGATSPIKDFHQTTWQQADPLAIFAEVHQQQGLQQVPREQRSPAKRASNVSASPGEGSFAS